MEARTRLSAQSIYWKQSKLMYIRSTHCYQTMLEKYGIDLISYFGMRLSDNGQDLNNTSELYKKKIGTLKLTI